MIYPHSRTLISDSSVRVLNSYLTLDRRQWGHLFPGKERSEPIAATPGCATPRETKYRQTTPCEPNVAHTCPVHVRSSLSLIATSPLPLGTACEDSAPGGVWVWRYFQSLSLTRYRGNIVDSADEDLEMLSRVYIFKQELAEIWALLWIKCYSNIIYSIRKAKQKVPSHCDWISTILYLILFISSDIAESTWIRIVHTIELNLQCRVFNTKYILPVSAPKLYFDQY